MRGASLRLTIGVLGTAVALAAEAFEMSRGEATPGDGLLNLAIGLTYLYGGLVVWGHEPANRTGRLMTLVGLTWFIGTLVGSTIPILDAFGLAFEDTSSIIVLALVLAYPSGHLETRVDRIAVTILAIGVTTLNVLQLTTVPLIVNEGINGLYAGLSLAIMTTVVVVRRWLIAPARSRRDLLPVLVAGVVLLTAVIINLVRRIADVPEDVSGLLVAAKDLAPAAIPIALLIGFFRQSERRLQALVDAIPDRMFRFARDGRYLDSRADESTDRATDLEASPGEPDDRHLHQLMFAEAGGAARESASRALDSGELQSYDFALALSTGTRDFEARVAPSGPDEVTAIVRDFTALRAADAEVRRSRARIVEATNAERRRLERDLHDGAQQRLVSLALALRLLRVRLGALGGANDDAIATADAAAAELKLAISELRELARGIHPAILTEAGLGPAMTALADRSAIPTVVGMVPDRRLSSAVEATAYFVVSEALANVAKYAGATRASIGAGCRGSILRVEVGDDGVGGADRSRGSGIRGLEDRVAAVGGRLTVDSPKGQGTLVVAEIPIS